MTHQRNLTVPALCVTLAVLMVSCAQRAEVKVVPISEQASSRGMKWIPGGNFTMGSEKGRADEAPSHQVVLSGFWIDETEVTNREFSEFVSATSYVTEAEKRPKAEDFPGVPADKLVPGALVFEEAKGWRYEPGANWRHPGGPSTDIVKIMDHPVVQVSWDDAVAYAKWKGKQLPTEAQFEYAARGGDSKAIYAWGVSSPNDSKPQANYWQGPFPEKNENTDKFVTTSPVKHFPPNKFGLFDVGGNVWEWCVDWYRPDSYQSSEKHDPSGPGDSVDPDEPDVAKRVVRGGSFLCAECYCSGYRLTARMKSSPDTGLMHTGFRCVINPKKG